MAGASMQDPPFEIVSSFDGTAIAMRRFGSGDRAPLLIANAVGANLAVWRHALQGLVKERTCVAWDLRGLLDSGEPRSERIDPGAHAEDAIAVLEAAGIQKVVVASWSNGSRVALEIAARHPERVTALALVCGGYGQSPSRLVTRGEMFSLLPTAAGVAKHFSSFFGAALRSVAGREITGLIRHSGLVAASTDVAALTDLLRGFAFCDPKALLATYEAVAGAHVPELLPTIQASTLVVAGERDHFTTRSMSEETARAIPGARLVVYEGATHFVPLEFPARLSEDLRRFFAGSA